MGDDLLVQLLVGMLNGIGQGPTGQLADLVKSPGEYNSTLFNAVVTLHDTAVKPVTAVVLSIVIVLALAENATRIEADRELGVKIVAATMFKATLVIIATQNSMKILSAIDEIVTDIGNAAMALQLGADGQPVMIGDQLQSQVEAAGAPEQLSLLVLLFLPWLLGKVAGIAVIVAIFLRFINLYLLTSFSSLGIAFFAHSETKHMGVGYLKRYASVALTAVVLIVAFGFYRALVGDWLSGTLAAPGDDLAQYVLGGMGPFLGAPLLLLFIVFGASSLARGIVGE